MLQSNHTLNPRYSACDREMCMSDSGHNVVSHVLFLALLECDVNFWHINQRQTSSLEHADEELMLYTAQIWLVTTLHCKDPRCTTNERIVRFAKAFAVCLLPSTPAWWTRMARSSWRQTTLSRSISDCTLRFTTTPKLCSSLLLWPIPQRMGTYWLHMCKHKPVYLDSLTVSSVSADRYYRSLLLVDKIMLPMALLTPTGWVLRNTCAHYICVMIRIEAFFKNGRFNCHCSSYYECVFIFSSKPFWHFCGVKSGLCDLNMPLMAIYVRGKLRLFCLN